MLRWIIRALAIVVFAVAALVVLDFAELLVAGRAGRQRRRWPTRSRACDGRVARPGADVQALVRIPSPATSSRCTQPRPTTARSSPTATRTTARSSCVSPPAPGDVIEGRDGTVFVDESSSTTSRPSRSQPVTVPNEQYFLLGDNRSAADRQPNLRPGARERDLRARVRRLLAAARHHVPARPGLGRAARRDRLRLSEFLRTTGICSRRFRSRRHP